MKCRVKEGRNIFLHFTTFKQSVCTTGGLPYKTSSYVKTDSLSIKCNNMKGSKYFFKCTWSVTTIPLWFKGWLPCMVFCNLDISPLFDPTVDVVFQFITYVFITLVYIYRASIFLGIANRRYHFHQSLKHTGQFLYKKQYF